MPSALAAILLSATLGQTTTDLQRAAIVGTWETIDRHIAMGSLYQPVHGVRKREGIVHFVQKGDQLSGFAVHAGHAAITHQERWADGRTEFRQVSFQNGRLTFQWGIGEWVAAAGPIAVERQQLENKGTVRVEARLEGDLLSGMWHMILADGTEVFRGEWEGWRAVGAPLDSGPVMLIGGSHQDLTDELRGTFFERAGGKKARIVIIPTATAAPEDAEEQRQLRQPWLDLGPASVEVLHTRDRATANDPAFVKPLTEATAVFFTNGHQHRVFDAYRGTLFEKELQKFHTQGGLVGGTGTGAVVLGEHVLVRPIGDTLVESGLGLLLGVTVEDDRDAARFPLAVAANPHYVGLLIDSATAAIIHGRLMSVSGQGTVTVRLATSRRPQIKTEEFRAGAECNLFELRTAARLESVNP